MRINANSLTANLLVTLLMLCMVIVLPWADRKICRRLGLNLQGGISQNPNADRLLRVRQGVLLWIFAAYLAVLSWVVFFSRSAAQTYTVHVALYEDLQRAVRIDFGFLEFFRILFTEGVQGLRSHVEIVKLADVTQVYMNIALFVPMGFLLPYLFRWFRNRPTVRPAAASFVISLLIENIQLITRRGFYDLDDLVSNTIGGILGQFLFIMTAYVVTHPAWRKDLKAYRRWKRNARSRTLYPFARKMRLSRTTLRASDEEAVWDFYVMKLGFRMIRQIVPLDSEGTDILLEMGGTQVEFHCENRAEELPPQSLTISVSRLKPIIRRLNANGIETGEITQDAYTGLRCVHFTGPDGVDIAVLER